MSHPTQLKCTQPNSLSENDVFVQNPLNSQQKLVIKIASDKDRVPYDRIQSQTSIWIMLEFRQENRYHAVLFRPENLLTTRLFCSRGFVLDKY